MIRVFLTEKEIDISACYQHLVDPRFGGINMFVGTIREWTGEVQTRGIRYTAYREMAEKEMQLLAREVEAKYAANVVIVHRLGELSLTEVAVFIGVATAHRAESYEGSRYIIEMLKKRVPIWKEEIDTDGVRWGGARRDDD